MRLDDETLAERPFDIGGRKKQLIEKALLRLAKAANRCILQRFQIKRVAVESQQRKLPGLAVELLTVAVHHENAGAGRRIDEGAALGHDGDLFLRISSVVD